MRRSKFIKTLSCAIIGIPLGISLLQSCESIYYAQSQSNNGIIKLKKTEFEKKNSKTPEYRSFVLVHKAIDGFPICIYRIQEETYIASLLKCTHQGCELEVGGRIYTCPCHGSEFKIDGQVTKGPADKDLKTYTITTDHENIYIHLT